VLRALSETVPGTGEVARFPAETLGTHKDGNTEHNGTLRALSETLMPSGSSSCGVAVRASLFSWWLYPGCVLISIMMSVQEA
jgi:hypothetical protein